MRKYSTLLSLYLAQSIPMSFFSTIVPVIMRQEHYSLESIGYLQLMKLPWILKFMWAPLVDNDEQSLKKYRRWILISELFYALIIIATGFLSLKTDFITIVILMLIAFTASATQDIATDAFAIATLNTKERSFGNSIQSAGTFIGTLTGSGVLLLIYHHYGWQALLSCLSIFVVLALIPLYAFKHRQPESQTPKIVRQRASFAAIGTFFSQKGMWKHTILLFFFYAGLVGTLAMLKPLFVDKGYSLQQIGTISGIYGTAIGAACAFIAGWLINRLGRRTSIYLVTSYAFITALLFVYMSYNDCPPILLYTSTFMLWPAYSMSSVIVYTIAMDRVRPGCEGTDFTIQIVITHLSSLIIASLSGKLADSMGYHGLFIAEAILAALLIVLIPFCYNEKSKLQ